MNSEKPFEILTGQGPEYARLGEYARQLGRELAEANAELNSRFTLDDLIASNTAIKEQLEKELAELREDKARLDWLLEDNVERFGSLYGDRKQIDAAMKGQNEC